jgi:hypothetical protein
MKVDDIKRFLDAYYDGSSTPEQEEILMQYFSGDDVADELLAEKEMFLEMQEIDSNIDIPSGFEDKIVNLVDGLAQQEDRAARPMQIRKSILLWFVSAAACIALIVSAGLYFNRQPLGQGTVLAHTNLKDTYTDPNVAYEEARKALLLVSCNLNKGINQLSTVEENIDKSNEILNRSLNHIK